MKSGRKSGRKSLSSMPEHVSSTSSGKAGGCWADVRRHPEKVLPVHWGLWKTRYCLAGPSQMGYYSKTNLTATPDAVVPCDSIEPHPHDDRVACLQHNGKTVSWLMLVDAATCHSFVISTLRVIQGWDKTLSECHGHTEEQQNWAAGKMQLEVVQSQLKRHETELASYRSSFVESTMASCVSEAPEEGEEAGKVFHHRHSMPARTRAVARSNSCSSSSDSDDEPLSSSICSDVVMDWPLSQAEKKLRLVQIMDRERAAAERQNRRLLRHSAPSPRGSLQSRRVS